MGTKEELMRRLKFEQQMQNYNNRKQHCKMQRHPLLKLPQITAGYTFVNTVIMDDEVITIAYNYADNDILDIPLSQIKNSPDSVRMSLIDWASRNNSRTLKKGSVIDFDISNHLIIYSFKKVA